MDAEMSPGESSNSNNNNNNHGPSATPDSSHKPSSSNNIEKTSSSIADDSSNFDIGDDIGWFCSLCTFRNSADKFKCEMCDLRRGTSTRKPRCNAETIVAQVVKQQEQIRQQTRVKTPKSSRSTPSTNLIASSPSGSKVRSKFPKSSRGNMEVSHSDSDDLSDSNSPPKPKRKKNHDTKAQLHKPKQSNANSRPLKEDNDESTESDYTSDSSESSSDKSGAALSPSDSSSSSPDSSDSTSDSSSTSNASSEDESDGPETTRRDSYCAMTPVMSPMDAMPIKRPVTAPSPIPQIKTLSDNPFKITPLEVSGNLIKYSPPTSSGRTGLIIDKKRFTQHSVTVNDVTITFTEFATRQNTYVRKKKKRRDGSRSKNGNSKSRSKSQPKSSNSASTTAAEAP